MKITYVLPLSKTILSQDEFEKMHAQLEKLACRHVSPQASQEAHQLGGTVTARSIKIEETLEGDMFILKEYTAVNGNGRLQLVYEQRYREGEV